MHQQNYSKSAADQKPDEHVHKGELHQAAATDDDTSIGSDRAADRDNADYGNTQKSVRDTKENGEGNLATKKIIMKVKKIAKHLADLCEKNEFETAQKEFYGEDVVSIEPQATTDYAKETRGRENVLAKIRKFNDSVETFHDTKVSDPLVAGNSFAFTLSMDLKMKGRERMEMEEICVYEVKDGKIISEQFFT
jgi:limonene-1,2-epoxide hydrolase